MTVRDSLKLKSLALTGPAAAFSPSSSAKRLALRWNNACTHSGRHACAEPACSRAISQLPFLCFSRMGTASDRMVTALTGKIRERS